MVDSRVFGYRKDLYSNFLNRKGFLPNGFGGVKVYKREFSSCFKRPLNSEGFLISGIKPEVDF